MSSQRSIPTLDRISTLPDSVICHILSFLPTKQSVTTTMISKRWNPLWLSVLTLDFDDQNFSDFATFRHFIYSVMLTRHTTLPIQSLRLKCGVSSGCNPYDINRIVRAALQRGIVNLILDFSYTDFDFQIGLSTTISSVFNCRNLVVLKLTCLTFTVVPQFNFPLLKTLHLDSVSFLGDQNEEFYKFVELCPILEELQTTNMQFWVSNDCDNGKYNKCFSNLVRAKICNLTWSWNVPFAWICNAKFLHIELSKEQKVHTFHNLTHFELIFKSVWQRKWNWLVELLEHCPKLQNLTLNQLYGHGFDKENWKEPKNVPECIFSQLRKCSFIAYEGKQCEFRFAEYILKSAKVLRTMTINASLVDINLKHQMLRDLSLCPRGSATCKLSFD
ncbi:unnamed protein product [Trifolium pratense]|uniref:Uncharacterized protein n=1 Tax=Trifolium pratense TaxID=57577 RepID=A0ACB0LNY6_TRIPR|nr:unnamed protein product [Trifolium pratense]